MRWTYTPLPAEDCVKPRAKAKAAFWFKIGPLGPRGVVLLGVGGRCLSRERPGAHRSLTLVAHQPLLFPFGFGLSPAGWPP